MTIFGDFDLTGFWSGSDYERNNYVGAPLTDALIHSVQAELGHKLPVGYLELMRAQNGGLPRKTCHATKTPTSWAEDHIAISGLYGVDRQLQYSLCGEIGSRFWLQEWGYPDIGVYFADCPSAGHDMLCLDYRNVTKDGEPPVVHVDQEDDYLITPVAPNFESFIRGLKSEEAFYFNLP